MRFRPALAAGLLAALLLANCMPSLAESPQAAARDLHQRLAQVLSERQQIDQTLANLRADLERLERQAQLAEAQSEDLARQEGELGQRMPQVRAELEELSPRLARGRREQARHLRALYLFGAEASQTLLASSQDFHDALTRSQYLAWLLEADRRNLAALNRRGTRLGQLQSQMAYRQNEARELRERLEEQRRLQEKLGGERRELLRELDNRRQALALNLQALKEAEGRLARTFALPPPEAAVGAGVVQAKGRLSPPVEGRVLGPSGPGNRGVLLEARPGAPVRSPWAGTVAHASPLAGYGRVVVVDHGQLVHTVLAHLGPLAVVAGQAIAAGQVLGTVDDNGRLYLEVRQGTHPENPLDWLRLGP